MKVIKNREPRQSQLQHQPTRTTRQGENIVEITGRAYGTVRASLQRFEQLGYIEPNQRIGRSELYVPTPALKRAVNDFAKKFWPHIQKVRNQSARVKDPA